MEGFKDEGTKRDIYAEHNIYVEYIFCLYDYY